VIVRVGHGEISAGRTVVANERPVNPCTGNFIHSAWA
jgi:hypothetical protein